MLSVRRRAAAVEFYKSALGADVVYRNDAPDGTVVARLSINGAEFWVADEFPKHKNCNSETSAEEPFVWCWWLMTRTPHSPRPMLPEP
jgi:uncharacterized glyoxalase superfamily protein PhnB